MAVFLAVAEAGSLSAAARELGQSQPTLGRKLRQIEARSGRPLFRRHPRGFELTEAGHALIGPALDMRAAIHRFGLLSAGQDAAMRGTVRITASEVVAHYVLPDILGHLRRDHAGIDLELVPSDGSENLLFREADIAVRMYRPTQLDIVTRHLGDLALGIFAARSYLDRRGRPRGPQDLMDHDLVGYDRDDRIIRGMRQAGLSVQRSDFAVRCDDQRANWELVRAGCGIGFAQLAVGLADPLVERILPEIPIPPLPVWLAAPEATRHSPRVAAVWDALAQALTRHLRGARVAHGHVDPGLPSR